MIDLVLILPLVFCFILYFLKNKTLNNILINLYAILHLSCAVVYFVNLEWLKNNQYFNLNSSNLIFYIILSVVFLAVVIYNNGFSKNLNQKFDDKKMMHYTLMLIAFVFSMTGAILSSNLGLAWIFIEGTTLASAYLIYFNKTKHSIEAAWKYVFICSIGIALAFVGIILLTVSEGNLNSLNYIDLIENAKIFNHFWLNVSFVFILVGIGTKMGLAPVHFWLPDAHAEAPSPISALLSAALLNCAFLVILNVYKVMIAADCIAYARIALFVMGFLSLFIAAVFLINATNYKRMLAYSSIENMGILTIALALGGAAYYALVLHLIGHSLIKASFFLTSGNIYEIFETKKIKSIRALGKIDIKTSWLWIASFLGICAFPPSVLFLSEFLVVKTFLVQHHFLLCFIFLFLLTVILYGMAKSVIKMVYGEISSEKPEVLKENLNKISFSLVFPQAVMLVFAFILGIYIPQFLDLIIKNTIS